jgi:predicted GNAT family N-acyltransferase
LLGRLAVDQFIAGKGYGRYLLVDALKKSYETGLQAVGSMAVVVDPVDKRSQAFYEKYGFILLPGSGKLFLPMKTIEKLF